MFFVVVFALLGAAYASTIEVVENDQNAEPATVKTWERIKDQLKPLKPVDDIVDDFNGRFEELFNKGDVQSIVKELYEENVDFYVWSRKIVGKRNVAKFFQQEKNDGRRRLVIFPRHNSIDELRNIFTTGQFVVYDKKKTIRTGHYTQVLRKGANGKYLVHVEFNDFEKY